MNVLNQKWYLSGDPWFRWEHVGTVILAGSPDPHAGTVVADLLGYDEYEDESSDRKLEQTRAIAAHIVDIHNASIQCDDGSGDAS